MEGKWPVVHMLLQKIKVEEDERKRLKKEVEEKPLEEAIGKISFKEIVNIADTVIAEKGNARSTKISRRRDICDIL